MYFHHFKQLLQHMAAFTDKEKSEEERYQLALIELLAVLREIQDVACGQSDSPYLDQFDYTDVKEWLLRDWQREFPNASQKIWNEIVFSDADVLTYLKKENGVQKP